MKKIAAVSIFAILAMVFAMPNEAKAQFTNHPRFSRIDTFVKASITKISIAEANFFAVHGRYFQGILTPDDEQHGMTDAEADWKKKPEDSDESWADFDPDFFKKTTTIPCQMEIGIYESPRGWGWVARYTVNYSGLGPDEFGNEFPRWIYQHHEGPAPEDPNFVDRWISVDPSGI